MYCHFHYFCYHIRGKFYTFFREEKLISRAIDLNEQLQKVMKKHDALLKGDASAVSSSNYEQVEEEEEEDVDCLLRRLFISLNRLFSKAINPMT